MKNGEIQALELLEKLKNNDKLSIQEFEYLIKNRNNFYDDFANEALKIRKHYYKTDVYFRALVEISSFCKNDCFYCGLRHSNKNAHRYRLSKEEILQSVDGSYQRGFRTFVLQGGEDSEITDEFLIDLIKEIKSKYSDAAVTLSLGERDFSSYEKLKNAGADRYLLRHETNDENHYSKLHPKSMSLDHRKDCLKNLKSLHFQTGCGMMVGSPFQTNLTLAKDLYFIQELQPEMVGIGPFIPADNTPFEKYEHGDLDLTYFLLAMIRLIDHKALIPITTALSTLDKDSIVKGLAVGGNVLMPNVSPVENRKNYSIYNDKKDFEIQISGNFEKLKEKIEALGFNPNMSIGNYGE